MMSWTVSILGLALLYGCAGAGVDYYPLDCKYKALTAAHAAEMQWGVTAYVATDGHHAQAFYPEDDIKVWLMTRNDCVVRNVNREVDYKISIWSLKQWDQLLRYEPKGG